MYVHTRFLLRLLMSRVKAWGHYGKSASGEEEGGGGGGNAFPEVSRISLFFSRTGIP